MANITETFVVGLLFGLLCTALVQGVCPLNCLENTNCDVEPDGGCPQCTEAYYGRRCQYRLECKHTERGDTYRGTLSTTQNGHTCWAWSYSSQNEANYCRNTNNYDVPFCYTSFTYFDLCYIPLCRAQCTAPPQPPGSELLNPAKPGEGFYDGYNAYIRCPGNVTVQSVCKSYAWTPISCPEKSTCPANCLANTDCDAEPDGGCPQCTEAYYGRQCQHRLECKYTEKGESYRGLLNTTPTGYACHTWSTGLPTRLHTDNEGNYCRNPDDSSTAWCYSTKPLTRFEYCYIPACDTQCTAPPQPQGSELLNPAKPGEGFYDGYTANIRCPGNFNVQSVCNSPAWSPVSCSVVYCERPMLKQNSYITYPQDKYKYGTIVDISCNAGFEIKGNSRLMCLPTKTWNGSFPTCAVIYCEGPMLKQNSYITYPKDNYRYGTIVDISCNAGYKIIGNSRLLCLATKSWNGSFPSCAVIYCESPLLKPNSYLASPQQKYEYETIIDISCNAGYEIKGNSTLRCMANKSWSSPFPSCTVIYCESPLLKPNSYLASPQQKYEYETIIDISCKAGYEIKGNSTLRCIANKSWSSAFPSCTVIYCEISLLKPNSYIAIPQNKYEYGAIINISCDAGYEIEGNTYLNCLINKSWNGTFPSCRVIQCDPPNLNNNSFITKYQERYEFGAVINIDCHTGFELESGPTLACLETKFWNGSPPICRGLAGQEESFHGSGLPQYAVALVVVAPALCLFILVVGLFVYRRNHKKIESKQVPIALDNPKDENIRKEDIEMNNIYNDESNAVYANQVSYDHYDSMSTDLIDIQQLPNYTNNAATIREKFESQEADPYYSQNIAQLPQNASKNKYKQMYPYDNNRVVLHTPNADGGYINASPIKDLDGTTRFIAAQGPILTTKDDFWQMVWELNISIIVMLTNPIEKGKVKCVEYWPTEHQLIFRNITVFQRSTTVFVNYVIRNLKVSQNSENRDVILFHFTSWPDKSVSDDPITLALFHRVVLNYENNPDVPTLVHCSAGVGRTGTYIALDLLLQEAKTKSRINPLQCLKHLRQQRFYMIQTPDQFVFLHQCLWEAWKLEKSLIPITQFDEAYTKMNFSSIVAAEYENLQKTDEKLKCLAGTQNENVDKNRCSTILPVDQYRPFLQGSDGGDYINAVFVEGVFHKHEYILTQSPLTDTTEDFWRLVFQEDVKTLVCLDNEYEESSDVYENTKNKFGQIEVKHISNNHIRRDFLITELEISKGKNSKKVTKITTLNWKQNDVCPDSADYMLDLIATFDKKHTEDDESPILIYCLDGSTKSGLVCLVHTIIARLKTDEFVIIPTAVEQLRKRRPQVIASQRQYEFCYDCVHTYLECERVYANT